MRLRFDKIFLKNWETISKEFFPGIKLDHQNSVEKFLDEYDEIAALHVEQYTFFLYLIGTGRYPQKEDLILLRNLILLNNHDEIIRFFLKKNKKRCILEFEILPKNKLLVDITHTHSTNHTSGIQRVVRKLAQNLFKMNADVEFINLEMDNGQFKIIDSNSCRIFNPNATGGAKYKKKLKDHVQGFFPHWAHPFLRFWYGVFLRTYRAAMNIQILQESKEPTSFLITSEHKILFPELMCEKKQLEIIKPILEFIKPQSTLILYDLIPVYNPEFCAITAQFIDYLRLLRHLDCVSCISETVKIQVDNFVKNINRSKKIKVESHLLGLDFDNSQPLPKALVEGSYILCVGTFEPRKNHLNLISAFKNLCDENKSNGVKLVLAGNPGWFFSDVNKYIKKLQKQGYPIVCIMSPTDAELANLYQNCLFTSFVSHCEGYGLPIVESAFFGKYCVTSNFGSMKEMADICGFKNLASPDDSKDISDKLSKQIASSDVYKKPLYLNRTWEDYTRDVLSFANPSLAPKNYVENMQSSQ